jgi:hypothetical protein
MHEAYQPVIEDGRGVFPEDFRVKAPQGFKQLDEHRLPRPHETLRPSVPISLQSTFLGANAMGVLEAPWDYTPCVIS